MRSASPPETCGSCGHSRPADNGMLTCELAKYLKNAPSAKCYFLGHRGQSKYTAKVYMTVPILRA